MWFETLVRLFEKIYIFETDYRTTEGPVMRKLIFVFIFFLIAFQLAFAQQDFRNGFIVTSQHDTIFLQIDYRSQAKNYESCRTKDGSGIKEYGPEDLLGYGFVDDKYFKSGIVEGSFVEVLVLGELSLYRHVGSYYAKKDDNLYHLEEKIVKIGDGSTRRVRTDTRWKGLLGFMISDCITGQEVLRKLRFDERRITNLVIQYNTCRPSPFTVYKASKPWTKAEAGIVLGMTRSTLAVDKEFHNIPYLNDQYQSFDPSIGFTLAISSPRISETLAFQPEVHLSQVNYSSTRVVRAQSVTLYDDTYINVTTISTPLLLRYSLPKRKYSMELNAGVTLDSHIKSDTRVVREVVTRGVVDTLEEDVFDVNKNQLGYMAGFCVVRSFSKFKAGLLLRYALLGGFSETQALPVQTRKLSLSLTLQKK